MNLLGKLKKARTLIRKGWGKHMFYNKHTGCYCLDGALRQANNPEEPWNDDTMSADMPRPHGALKALGFRSGRALYEWNDNFDRRKSHVLKRLTDAIKKLEAAA